MLKIKGARLSGWDRARGVRGCPHCPDAGADGGHTFHTMCFWRRLGLWHYASPSASSSFLCAVFRLKLPRTPPGAWLFVDHSSRNDETVVDTLHDLLQKVWVHHVLSCFQAIWSWRQGVNDDENPSTQVAALSALRGRLVGSLRSIGATITSQQPGASALHRLLAACRNHVAEDPVPPAVGPRAEFEYVLFFDGGSRGNPGPGGAGAVVVRVDKLQTSATIVWSAAMSLASPTTINNRAEYLGLVTGLSAALRHGWTPLQVVGDSALIIGQLGDYRPPKTPTLRGLYAAARGLADQLGVSKWSHHLRAFNKMADAAANVAMDGRRSIQTFHPTDRPEWAGLSRHLLGDFTQWQASQFGPSSSG